MNHKRLSLIVVTAIFILLFQMNAYSVVCFNGAGNGYENPSRGTVLMNNTLGTMEYYIVESTGYYLNAGSNIHALLYMVEMQDARTGGLDFAAVNKVVDNAAIYMNRAREMFERLIREAETTPYNETVQARLKTFDYDSFAETNDLNKEIFASAKNLLKNGDITGIFKKAHSEFAGILKLLQTIKTHTSQGSLPGVDIFWQLNEKFSTESLFGSYVARIFTAVNK